MDYHEYLQRSGEQDSPSLRQAFQEQFGGANNLGLGSQIELQERGVHGRLMSNPREVLYSPEGQEGRNFLVATDRYHNDFPLSGALEEQEALEAFRNEEFTHNPLTGELAGDPWQVSDTGSYTPSYEETLLGPESPYLSPSDSLAVAPNLPPPAASTSLLSTGPSGYASLDAAAGTSLPYAGQGISEELAAQTAAEAAGESGWGGPATFAANQALNLIPTRDRDKKVTPFGDEGSMSGILKGTGKGALFGATIGSAFPVVGTTVGAVGGGVLGALGGAQGYFDSTSAPMISMSRIKRRGGGMQGGLLGGGSMYG